MARGLAGPRAGLLFVLPILVLIAVQPLAAAAADAPEITARYGVVISADTGEVLFDKGMSVPAPPASLTKIFTAAVALESAPLDTRVTVDPAAIVGEASMGLRPGEEVSLRTLLYGMLLPSGNDAALAIAQSIGALPTDTPAQAEQRFMKRMATTTQRLGLTGTHLVNPHGLDQPGHVSTARDLAAMTMYLLQNPTFREIIGASYYDADGHPMYQSNHLLTQYPGLIGGKTGITDAAGYCLIEVAKRDGHTIIAVVLGSTVDDWYRDAQTLLDQGFAALAAQPTDPARPTVTLAPVAPVPVSAPDPVATVEGAPTLSVDRIADTTAVVRSAGAAHGASGFSWRWPLASVATMGVTLALIVNYPILLGIGGLALQRRPAARPSLAGHAGSLARAFLPGRSASRTPRGRTCRAQERPTFQPPAPRVAASEAWIPTWSTASAATAPAAHSHSGLAHRTAWPSRPAWADAPEPAAVVRLNPAEAIAARAVRLAERGQYPAATAEFASALELDPALDLTRCSGFWTMQPLGYVAAARAYLLLERPADARTLATVVQLSYGSSRDLERLLERSVATGAWR